MPLPVPTRTYPVTFIKRSTIQVLHKDDAVKSPPEVVCPKGIYEDVKTARPWNCNHTTTMCWECADIWHQDHWVRPFKHGVTGRSLGCICQICLDSASRARRKQYLRKIGREV